MKLSQDDAILFCENLGGSSLTFKTTRKDFIDDAVYKMMMMGMMSY